MSETKRTRKEVDADYSHQAILVGHKYRVLAQIKADQERIEGEIKLHVERLLELNKEGMSLPLEEVKTEEAKIEVV